LDQAALRTVLSWRYEPGKRAGVAQDMWFDVPIVFQLN
jgi:protein TonB